jgi:hypothetical protein
MKVFPVLWGYFEQFSGYFQRKCVAFIKIMRLFQRNGVFNKKFEAFSKITRLFEAIFNGIEAFLK